MRALYDAALLPANDLLGVTEAEAARERGRTRSLDQALAEALGWLTAGSEQV
jgi:hypothetical protein